MNIPDKTLSWAGLFGCWLYLITCITFDIIDPVPNEEMSDPDKLYFISQFLLMDTLIFIGYQKLKHLNKWHEWQWFGFMMLSFSQTTKNIFFNPTIRTINDYFYLLVVVIFVIYKLKKKQ